MTALTISDLNNAKADVDHVAAIATSPALSTVDRLGQVKKTIAGVLAEIPNSGVLGKATWNAMAVDLQHAEGTVCFVTNDPDPTLNTTYRKEGARGAGTWAVSSSSMLDLLRADISATLDSSGEPGFSVAGADGGAVMTIDSTGLARLVELKVHEALSVRDIGIDSNDQYRFSVTDEEGNALLTLTDDDLRVLALSLGKAGGTIDAGEAPFEVVDNAGSSALRVETDGSVSSKTLNVANQFRFPGEVRPAVIPADITMVIAYGQSWAVGFENQAVSLVSRFPNLMFNGGVRTQCVSDDPAVSMNAFAPLVEHQDDHTPEFPAFPGGVGESTGTGSAEMVSELLKAENNITHANARCQFLVTAPGEGSKSIEGLSDGSVCFTRLKKQILAGYQLAQAAGKTFAVGAVTWVQGGSDGPNQAYPAQLEALRVAVDSYAKSVTGQVKNVELVTWQSFPLGGAGSIDDVYWRHVVGLDQYPHIHTAGPSYFFDNSYYNADGTTGSLHFNGLSSKWLAGYLGLAMKRVICDGEDWQPLRPTRLLRQGRLCSIDFHVPVGSLVADTTRFHAQPNLGFNLYASNGAELPLASAAIAGRATVVLQAVDVIPAGAFVRYGGVQSEWGRHTGSGGNLRDTQGDLITFDGGGFDLPMHNWCVVFNEVISN